MIDYKNEWDLLLETCRSELKLSPKTNTLAKIDYTKINWPVFIQMARYHKVRALVYRGFSCSNEYKTIPTDILNQLKGHSKFVVHRNFLNTKELLRIGEILNQHCIEFIPYKGVVLSMIAYDNVGIRESSDIDLLIKASDYRKCKIILEAENYIEKYSVPTVFKSLHSHICCENNFEKYNDHGQRLYHIDLHWAIGPKTCQTEVLFNDLEKFTKIDNFYNMKCRILNSEGLFLTTLTHHGYEDGWNFLKNMADLSAIVNTFGERMDWKIVLNTCKKHNILNPIIFRTHTCK